MGNAIIWGNVFTLLAMVCNAISSTRKTPQGVLWVQNLSQGVYVVSAIVLKGYSAAVQNVVSILRNLAAIKKVESKALEWSLVALGVVFGLWFNNRGWVGLLPVVGNLVYTLAIFRYRDNERKIKIFFMISVLAFGVFNIAIQNYVGVVSDMVVVITTAANLIRNAKKAQA